MVCQDYKKIAIIALTRGGCRTALRLGGLLPGADVYLKAGALAAEEESAAGVKYFSQKLADLIAEIYGRYQGFVMIMAAGIVFRTFAPYVVHKSQDSAVVVLDEQAHFAISLLAGHLGGANQLAREVAERWGKPDGVSCQAVITTATDVRQKPAFDLLAQANNCHIANLSELKYISSALVNGGRVAFLSDLDVVGAPPEVVICAADDEHSPCPDLVVASPYLLKPQSLPWAEHILHLIPRVITLGVGCKRGTEPAALQQAAADFLAKNGVEPRALCQIASIDLKKDEPAILALTEHYKTPFVTYTAEELRQEAAKLPGGRQSDFVRRTVGTPGVAEPAALLAAGGMDIARLIEGKTVYPGITLSLALDTRQVFKF